MGQLGIDDKTKKGWGSRLESDACIQGVQADIDEGVGQVIIETDAMAVVQAVYSNAFEFSAMAHIVAELRFMANPTQVPDEQQGGARASYSW